MLSAVLHSDTAIEVSICIMNAFIEMRKFILSNQLLFQKISDIELKQLEYQNLTDEIFNKEYPILKMAKTDKFHDRFIIIDNKELYHCGASLKDLGKKCFGINRIEDVKYIESLLRAANI